MQEINIHNMVKDVQDSDKFRADLRSIFQESALAATKDLAALSKALVKEGKLQSFEVIVDQNDKGQIVTKTKDGLFHVRNDLQSQSSALPLPTEAVPAWGSAQRQFYPSADNAVVYLFDKNKHDNLSVVLCDYLSHSLGRQPTGLELDREIKSVAAANKFSAADFTKLPDGFRLVIPAHKIEPVVSKLIEEPHKEVATKPLSKPTLPIEGVPNSDAKIEQHVRRSESATGKTIELYKLDHRSADHNTADAIVHLPANFDPKKPINLVVYNHGWGDTAKSAFVGSEIERQLAGAPPNTVLIVPEWQQSPGARSSADGKFANKGMFRGMLQEIFDKTPELKGKKVEDLSNLSLIAHSAGYKPSEAELYNNGLFDKVKSITLLDANYDDHGFDRWLQANIKDLHDGKKQFYNFFYGTSATSRAQAERAEQMLQRAGLDTSCVLKDTNHGGNALDHNSLSKYSVVFKYSDVCQGGRGAHMSMPVLYVAPVLKASNESTPHNLMAEVRQPTSTQRKEVGDGATISSWAGTFQPESKEQHLLHTAALWHMSQKGDHANPDRWFACSATSLHMALLKNNVPGFGQNESQRMQLVSDLHVSRLDGFHGGVDGMAAYARKFGLHADVHHSVGAENDLVNLECALRSQDGGAIVNGGLFGYSAKNCRSNS